MNDIKILQSACLDILKEIDKVCKKNNIKYCLYAGTLLGAVRHGGFIPWDDDLDIAMLREDYERFLSVALRDLSPEFFLQTYHTDKKYISFYAKLRKNNTIYEEPISNGIHKGIFVDIFPLDKKIKKGFFLECNRIKLSILIHYHYLAGNNPVQMYPRLNKKFIKFIFRHIRIDRNKTKQKIETLLQKYNHNKDCTNIVSWSITPKYTTCFQKEWFDDFIDVNFENINFPIPIGYHEILTTCYGDYMILPPEEKRSLGHCVRFMLNTKENI